MWVDHLILFPTRGRLPIREGTSRVLQEGIEVCIFRAPSRVSPPAITKSLKILHFIGNASRAECELPSVLEFFPPGLELLVWSVNYPGYGKSEGQAALSAIPGAALSAYDALAAEGDPKTPILISGNSLGTTAALYLAAHRPCAGLILRNPPPIQDMILKRYGWWNLWFLARAAAREVPAELNSLLNAPRVHTPAVFLTSERDFTVPPKFQRKVIRSYGGEHRDILLAECHHDAEIPDSAHSGIRNSLQWLAENAITRHIS